MVTTFIEVYCLKLNGASGDYGTCAYTGHNCHSDICSKIGPGPPTRTGPGTEPGSPLCQRDPSSEHRGIPPTTLEVPKRNWGWRHATTITVHCQFQPGAHQGQGSPEDPSRAVSFLGHGFAICLSGALTRGTSRSSARGLRVGLTAPPHDGIVLSVSLLARPLLALIVVVL